MILPCISKTHIFIDMVMAFLKKKKTGLVLSLFLGVLFTPVALITMVTESNINLDNCEVITGQVAFKDIIRIKQGKYKKNHFLFNLVNSNQSFTIFRSYEGYSDLDYQVRPGDTLKVYFKPVESGYNKNVYQVEKGDRVLVSIDEYRKASAPMPVLLLFTGLFLIVHVVLSFKKMSIASLLTSIVDKASRKMK
jgi:hypothetical protein